MAASSCVHLHAYKTQIVRLHDGNKFKRQEPPIEFFLPWVELNKQTRPRYRLRAPECLEHAYNARLLASMGEQLMKAYAQEPTAVGIARHLRAEKQKNCTHMYE